MYSDLEKNKEVSLEAYQERVIRERADLEKKLSNLERFIDSPLFGEVKVAEGGRLFHQKAVMEEYIEVLTERIDAF